MKRRLLILCAAVPVLTLSACVGGYGRGVFAYSAGPYAYDGFYDDHYGAIYDGYWGDDGGFYYRNGEHDRRFRRGDPAHFSRTGAPGASFHPIQGAMVRARGMRMPHFSGDQGRGAAGAHDHH